MFSLSKNRSYGRSVFWSPSLSPLWQAQSFLRKMSQPTKISQIENTLWMDRPLEMVIHSQQIVLVLQSHTITHSTANSEEMMVLSCSWMGEYTSVNSYTWRGGVQETFQRSVSPFNWQRGENVNEIDSGCQAKSLEKTKKEASGHLQQIFKWASTNFPVGSRQQRSSEQFSTQQKQQGFFFWHHQRVGKASGHSKKIFRGQRMLISCKGQMDPFVTWHLMEFSSEIQRWIRHTTDSWSLQIAVFQHLALAGFQAMFLRINMRNWKMVTRSYFGFLIEGGNFSLSQLKIINQK